jgi:PadR family transcriptional regulator, regulatory protein PadR
MATSTPTSAALRPERELLIAWLLLLLGNGPSYGYQLRRALRARGLTIDAATMYRVLRKLDEDGLVASRWTESIAGPRRRLYRVTGEGRRALDALAGKMTAIRDTHDAFAHAYSVAHPSDAGENTARLN